MLCWYHSGCDFLKSYQRALEACPTLYCETWHHEQSQRTPLGLLHILTHLSFPPVRACLFVMDGLLIDSEDKYTDVTNAILREFGRPDIPWHIKAQLQGRPGPSAGKIFRAWAQLPLTDAEFMERQVKLQKQAFQHCKPLPGVENLLHRLSKAHTIARREARRASSGSASKRVHMAVATSSHRRNYELKTKPLQDLFSVFEEKQVVVGDDPRIGHGRGKPLPDIYLLALKTINEAIDAEGEGERQIKPEECLVFEDSVPGIEAGRRAGMRVVWVPHPGLLGIFEGREKEVLAGLTGEHKDEDLSDGSSPVANHAGQVGEVDDGWGEMLETLEHFDYLKYGIDIGDTRFQTESGQPSSPGTTEKELEEMTAKADGKHHATEEGVTRRGML
jgi:pseudouridine-5'-monophosphatase